MAFYTQRQLDLVAAKAAARKIDSSRHKCFISYHAEDSEEVADFLDTFGSEFIAKTVGVTDDDDFIDSDDTSYVMDKIRTEYLGDSSVTIVLVGKCTWARRYVDWEVYSSLRSSKHSKVNGLLAIELPSISGSSNKLPARVADNITRDKDGVDKGFGCYHVYPGSRTTLRNLIDDAFDARLTRTELIDNSRDRRIRNASCS